MAAGVSNDLKDETATLSVPGFDAPRTTRLAEFHATSYIITIALLIVSGYLHTFY